jgi:transposase-like protein
MPVKELDKLTLADLWREVKDEETLWGDLKEEAQRMLKALLEGGMREELGVHLGCLPYERREGRLGLRNGYYSRYLETSLGLLHLQVPRDREGLYHTSLFSRYARRQKEVEDLIRDCFLAGISTRRIGETISTLLDFEVSAQTVSRITQALDREVESFHRRPLEDHYLYLFLDGITLKVKGALGVKKRLVLVAYGITREGKRELLDFRLASSESEESWRALLDNLYRRGLEGKNLRLLIIDGCPGLRKAVDLIYPYVAVQRCWVHKLRNVASYLPKKVQKEVLKGAKAIYEAPNQREARELFRQWARCFRPLYPKAVGCLEQDLEELLSFLELPQSHRRKVRTTNVIERAFREVRRRTRPISSFTNKASCERIIYGVISYLNQKWKDTPLKEFTHKS